MYGECLHPSVLLLPLGFYMMRINILCASIVVLVFSPEIVVKES